MAVMDDLMALFKKKRSIEKVTAQELRKEQIRMEQEEQVYTRRIDEVERKKQELFLKGKDENSQRQQVVLARKIKKLDTQARNMDKHLQIFQRQAQVVDGLLQVKENKRLLKEMGVGGLLSKIDLEELGLYVEQATVDGQFHLERFGELVKRMEEQKGLITSEEEEADIQQIVAAMQDAKTVEATDPEQAVSEGLEQVDRALRSGQTETDL